MEQFKFDQQQNNSRDEDINLLSMIESRIMEIKQIESDCKRKFPKLYLQRLPRYMRRRAASHNVNRLPKHARAGAKALAFGSKTRKSLHKHRRKVLFKKRKRCLRKHSMRAKNRAPVKPLLHKWFAKRFKMCSKPFYIPFKNTTKNERNLYKQSRYGCAYISLGILSPLVLPLTGNLESSLSKLNHLTDPKTGFTFLSKALRSQKYEVLIHLFEPDKYPLKYICAARVTLGEVEAHEQALSMWIPVLKLTSVQSMLNKLTDTDSIVHHRDWARIRLIGPKAWNKTGVIIDKDSHTQAKEECRLKLDPRHGISIGRYLRMDDKKIESFYYNSDPPVVDVVFKSKEGRKLWYNLVKNRAHLVGGYNDIKRLVLTNYAQLIPEIIHEFEHFKNEKSICLIRDEVILDRLQKVNNPSQFDDVRQEINSIKPDASSRPVIFAAYPISGKPPIDLNNLEKNFDRKFTSFSMHRGHQIEFGLADLEIMYSNFEKLIVIRN